MMHHRWHTLIVGIAALGACLGLGSHVNAAALPPALELKKVVCFPLAETNLPKTSEGLAAAIKLGLDGRVVLPKDGKIVCTSGSEYPSLEQITVDLTNASITSDRKLPKLKPRGTLEQGVRAREFRFMANPVKIDGANINLDIQAKDVELNLQRDGTKNPILVFAAAQEGSVRCNTTMTDLSRIFRASASVRGKDYGLSVQRADLKLTSPDEHQLLADLRLGSTLWFVPMAMHFTARVQVNEHGEAFLSNLTCDGDDVAGWLISGFIRPSLAKYNGKTVPLVSFPTDQIKLHDLRVKIDGEDIHVSGAFGK